ncbi:hypothetical protein PG997_000175 [Apiospora hydei]|uniref:Nuclear pore protein n=1 Tax=Apiospora hydei TaxID=1337664 RepID=A0ABR1X9Z0_9PEZI
MQSTEELSDKSTIKEDGNVDKIVMEEDGDLVIRVLHQDPRPPKRAEFLVDSRAVSRSSEMCKALVASKRYNPGRCKFDRVSKSVPQLFLFNLLKITERYEATHLLRPWIAGWIMPRQDWPDSYDRSYPFSSTEDLERLLYIAWIVVEKECFRSAISIFLENINPDEKSEQLSIYSLGLPLNLEIPGYSHYLKKEYLDKVNKLRSIFKDVAKDHSPTFCLLSSRPEIEQAMCNAILTGSIVSGYQEQELKVAGKCQTNQSINSVFQRLMCISIHSLPMVQGLRTSLGKTHDDCNPVHRMRSQLVDVMSSIANVLDEEIERHLDQRAELMDLHSP